MSVGTIRRNGRRNTIDVEKGGGGGGVECSFVFGGYSAIDQSARLVFSKQRQRSGLAFLTASPLEKPSCDSSVPVLSFLAHAIPFPVSLDLFSCQHFLFRPFNPTT